MFCLRKCRFRRLFRCKGGKAKGPQEIPKVTDNEERKAQEPQENPKVLKTPAQKTISEEYCLQNLSVVKLLGQGSFGIVFLLKDETDGSYIVDKVSPPDLWRTLKLEYLFMRLLDDERYFLSPVAHFKSVTPDIIEGCHLFMEHFEGMDLLEFVNSRTLKLHEFQQILLQLGEALKHMHSKGVIHRDLKPQNILISDDLRCKIIDFGTAYLRPESRGYAGTITYSSPEVNAHLKDEEAPPYGYSCDYYSLGVTALTIGGDLCDTEVFVDLLEPNDWRYISKIKECKSRSSTGKPDSSFYDLLNRLLDVNPSKRLDDETFLCHPFFKKDFRRSTQENLEEDPVEQRTVREFLNKLKTNPFAVYALKQRINKFCFLLLPKDEAIFPKPSKSKKSCWSRIAQFFTRKQKKAVKNKKENFGNSGNNLSEAVSAGNSKPKMKWFSHLWKKTKNREMDV